MAESIPAKLRSAQIAPFAKRAAQLERFKPIISYWLRFYIVQKIIGAELHLADAECTTYTTDLMEQLEQIKAENPNEDAILDEVAASAYCEQFALQTFSKGDKDMMANSVTKGTADTLLAASTFFEMLAIWKRDADLEIKSKQKYAKFHAARILKAFQAGQDPNASNPVHETPPAAASPSAFDPNDPDVQSLEQSARQRPTRDAHQASVEQAPDNPGTFPPDGPAGQVSPPPPNLPAAPTGYSSHRDVSPISQPTSRNGSVGGGYFPKVDIPTFTADTTAPSLPTAPSIEDETMTDATFHTSSLLTGPETTQSVQGSDIASPQDFYQTSSPSLQPPQQPTPQTRPERHAPQFGEQTSVSSVSSQHGTSENLVTPRPTQLAPSQTQSHPVPQSLSQPYTHAPMTSANILHEGPFRTDEEAQLLAQKHAKWAISALNFEDVNTAVKELRLALKSLGAS